MNRGSGFRVINADYPGEFTMEKVQRPYETKAPASADCDEEWFEPTAAAFELGEESSVPPPETAVRKRTPTPRQVRGRMSRGGRTPALLGPTVVAILKAAHAIRN